MHSNIFWRFSHDLIVFSRWCFGWKIWLPHDDSSFRTNLDAPLRPDGPEYREGHLVSPDGARKLSLFHGNDRQCLAVRYIVSLLLLLFEMIVNDISITREAIVPIHLNASICPHLMLSTQFCRAFDIQIAENASMASIGLHQWMLVNQNMSWFEVPSHNLFRGFWEGQSRWDASSWFAYSDSLPNRGISGTCWKLFYARRSRECLQVPRHGHVMHWVESCQYYTPWEICPLQTTIFRHSLTTKIKRSTLGPALFCSYFQARFFADFWR